MTNVPRSSVSLLCVAVTALTSAIAGQAVIDPIDAAEVFATVRSFDRAELTSLWGRTLSCPLILVDPETRQAAASHPDSAGVLQPANGFHAGVLPETVGIANYALDWGGRRWTMLMWPLPARLRDRNRLLAHELLHCLQPDLGIVAGNPRNVHLDSEAGRLWLRMEWRALEDALIQEGASRRSALEDALLFRQHRRSLFVDAAAEEQALEWNEGLAEYTGLRGSGLPAHVLADRAAVDLASWDRRPSFTRAFAYASGPAYGILLDESGRTWHDEARRGADLGQLAASAYRIGLPDIDATELARRGERYEFRRVQREERQRAERMAVVLADLTRRFVDGPVVRLPSGSEFSYSFDPNAQQPFRDGTVHPRLRITDEWGILEVTANGVWLPRTDGRVSGAIVPAPAGIDSPVKGDGWELRLAAGWRVVPGSRTGDWVVVKR